jgi:hypothetical protein
MCKESSVVDEETAAMGREIESRQGIGLHFLKQELYTGTKSLTRVTISNPEQSQAQLHMYVPIN